VKKKNNRRQGGRGMNKVGNKRIVRQWAMRNIL